jgi:hypothetical protein
MFEPTSIISFVDLDDTLFSSKRRQGNVDGLEPAALLENGEVISYSNPGQRAFLSMISGAGVVIPVTARDYGAFKRVLVSFSGPAVLSHGATILNQTGEIDFKWRQTIAASLRAVESQMRELYELIQSSLEFQAGEVRSWLVCDDVWPAYVVVKDNSRDLQRLSKFVSSSLAGWLKEHSQFRIHQNGNNVAILAPGVSKERAVSYLIAQARNRSTNNLFLGIGDSLTDEPFMRLCDFAIIPQASQLAQELAQHVEKYLAAHVNSHSLGES